MDEHETRKWGVVAARHSRSRTNAPHTVDWARYGEVVRSVEEAQTALVRELLGLLDIQHGKTVPLAVDLHEHVHLGEGELISRFKLRRETLRVSHQCRTRQPSFLGLNCQDCSAAC